MMIDVELTKFEVRLCTVAGRERYINALENARNGGKGASRIFDGPHLHIRGCLGEYATSIGVNLYWRPAVGLIHQKDVGGLVQCRCVNNERNGLCIKPRDPDADPFVLVEQLDELNYRLVGWRFAQDVKAGYPLREDRGDPAHFCERQLDDMGLLLEWITARRRKPN
jgi:hypothetical protein